MAEEKGQHEPSMEEILASIRRIIAADEGSEQGAAAPEDGPRAGPGTETGTGTGAGAAARTEAAATDDDVLELTDVIEENEPVATPSEMPLAHDGTPLLKLDDELPPIAMPASSQSSSASPFLSQVAAREDRDIEDARLISSTSAAASVAALSQLVNRPRERNGELPLGNANRTLEDLVRDMIRPMLKDWLDEHLPHLVERLVHDEIERLVREAQGH